jgi:hypothetical protein
MDRISISESDVDVLPWCPDVEALLRKWSINCQERSVLHARRSTIKKRLYRMLSIPAIIIPIAMASFSQLYSVCHDYEAQVVNSLGYLVSGSLAGISGFLNYGNQYAQHAQFEVLYFELYTEIECILAKPASFRGHTDVVLMRLRLTYDALNKSSPDL